MSQEDTSAEPIEAQPVSADAEPGRADSLRDRIVAVATQLFGRSGYAATSMREVAEAASCTKPALYYYFKGKDALYLAVIEHALRQMTGLIQRALDRDGTVRQRVEKGIDEFFAHARQHPDAVRLLYQAEVSIGDAYPSFDFSSALELHLRLLRQILEPGIASGELRSDLDLEEASLALAGMVDFRVRLYVQEDYPLPPDASKSLVDLLFRGVVDA